MASLGFRAITSKNMVFYFLRKPFDGLIEKNKELKQRLKDYRGQTETVDDSDLYRDRIEAIGVLEPRVVKNIIIIYLAKPVILCSTCMASVHTLIWYPILIGWDRNLILVMLMVAIFNTIIWSVVELIGFLIKRYE